MLKYQKTCQIILLILGVSMVSYGAVRGEAATVLGKSNKTMSGVCRNWIRKKNYYQKTGKNTWMDTGRSNAADQYSYSEFI